MHACPTLGLAVLGGRVPRQGVSTAYVPLRSPHALRLLTRICTACPVVFSADR
jgi:hypothetical protein